MNKNKKEEEDDYNDDGDGLSKVGDDVWVVGCITHMMRGRFEL